MISATCPIVISNAALALAWQPGHCFQSTETYWFDSNCSHLSVLFGVLQYRCGDGRTAMHRDESRRLANIVNQNPCISHTLAIQKTLTDDRPPGVVRNKWSGRTPFL